MPTPLETYLRDVSSNHAFRGAVAELACYPVLRNLLDEVGKRLTPPVRCDRNLEDTDAGPFTAGCTSSAIARASARVPAQFRGRDARPHRSGPPPLGKRRVDSPGVPARRPAGVERAGGVTTTDRPGTRCRSRWNQSRRRTR